MIGSNLAVTIVTYLTQQQSSSHARRVCKDAYALSTRQQGCSSADNHR